uniref:Reverse transcriptase zinc-binding domain-containing protein n=1 Tax=Davidia involucrata TaxID=16924 RepID=A0A5B7B299_DAVIN
MLRSRHLPVDPSCLLCNSDFEPPIHLFGSCFLARQVWYSSNLQVDSQKIVGRNFIEWWLSLVRPWSNLGNKDEIIRVAIFLLWQIWKARNAKVFSNVQACPLVTAQTAHHLALEFSVVVAEQAVHNSPSSSVSSSPTSIGQWVLPPFPLFKLNVD